MRGSYRTTFTASVLAALILWYFINIHRGFLAQYVPTSKQTQNNDAANHPTPHRTSPTAKALVVTKHSESLSPKATQASKTGSPLAHVVSSTQEPNTAATKSPATSVDVKDGNQEVASELPLLKQEEVLNQSGLKKGELVMVVASSGNGGYLGVPGIREMVYENRMSYADRWGHELMWANMSSYSFSVTNWNKVLIIQEAIVRYPEAKWFWWLDFDAIIVNGSVNFYDHILSPDAMKQNLLLDKSIPQIGGGPSAFRSPVAMDADDVNALLAFDDWGLNTGSLLFRRSEWTDMVLEIWADPLAVEKNWIFTEQDGFVHAYQHHTFMRKHTGIVGQRVLNGYSESNVLGAHWQSGDFIVHFPGCGGTKNMTNCHNNWLSYWEKRDNYTTPDWILRQIEDGTTLIESVQGGKF